MAWFLVRVIPKPSRAAYPCQRVAAPLASGFVIWLAAALGSTLTCRKAGTLWNRSRYFAAGLFAIAAVGIVWTAVSVTAERRVAAAPFVPADPPNAPVGAARGIHPGRVVWVYDPNAANWDGLTGNWWDPNSTDQACTDAMVSLVLRSLTGEDNDANAWNALFRHFNQDHGSGGTGYRAGEKIAIKINMNADDSDEQLKPWAPDAGLPSPQVIYSLLHQLIDVAGVPVEDVTLYDASRPIGEPIYNTVHGDPNHTEFAGVKFVVWPYSAGNGRDAARAYVDLNNPVLVHFADPCVPAAYLPTVVVEAKYLVNIALFRSHQYYGVSLCAKNHYGSLGFPKAGCAAEVRWRPAAILHDLSPARRQRGASYSPLVDLIGHPHLGGKTLLYMIDALYGQADQKGGQVPFRSFGDDWCSSLFVSQDPVAIDSVGLDFLRNEPVSNFGWIPDMDNYLHEAVLADNPPSGTFYDPQSDGVGLASLGVHEHWNNPVDKQYSRNLGTGAGIELLAVRPDDEPSM